MNLILVFETLIQPSFQTVFKRYLCVSINTKVCSDVAKTGAMLSLLLLQSISFKDFLFPKLF